MKSTAEIFYPLPECLVCKLEVFYDNLGFSNFDVFCKGKLIYRGESSVSGMNAVLMSSKSDLLLPSTYSPVSVDFFDTLNVYMRQQVDTDEVSRSKSIFPENGHLVTSDPMVASAWGGVVSIWPIDS